MTYYPGSLSPLPGPGDYAPPDDEHLEACEDQIDETTECICDELTEDCWGCGRVATLCGCP